MLLDVDNNLRRLTRPLDRRRVFARRHNVRREEDGLATAAGVVTGDAFRPSRAHGSGVRGLAVCSAARITSGPRARSTSGP